MGWKAFQGGSCKYKSSERPQTLVCSKHPLRASQCGWRGGGHADTRRKGGYLSLIEPDVGSAGASLKGN